MDCTPLRTCTGRRMHLDWVETCHYMRSYSRQLRPLHDCYNKPASVKIRIQKQWLNTDIKLGLKLNND